MITGIIVGFGWVVLWLSGATVAVALVIILAEPARAARRRARRPGVDVGVDLFAGYGGDPRITSWGVNTVRLHTGDYLARFDQDSPWLYCAAGTGVALDIHDTLRDALYAALGSPQPAKES